MGGGSSSSSSNNSGGILPYLALVASQLITSSWHVLGKHVMHQVPFLTPIAFVLARTVLTAVLLLTLGRVCEGHVPYPPLFCTSDGTTFDSSLCHADELDGGFVEEKKSASSLELAENGSSDSMDVLTKRVVVNGSSDTTSSTVTNGHGSPRDDTVKRRRRKMAKGQLDLLREFILNNTMITKSSSTKSKITISINPEVIQIVSASMAGMLLLPLCYTTGLILTNPTVASVWDGPMIPLGVFCTAVTLGVEKLSRKRPVGQVCSLLLTVGGSIVVLLIDFFGAHNKVTDHETGEIIGHANHLEFIRGNIVLMAIIGAYSSMSLLQKQLTHYPPITLTGWMMANGFLGCCCLLLIDSVLDTLRGSTITGCNFGQAISQFTTAWVSSPTFRYGMVYASLFVGGACFSIMSYASSHLDASIITLFAAIQPPITAVMEWIWEGKELGWKKIIAMIFVGIGMFGFTYIKKAESHHHHHRHKRSGLNGKQSKRTR
eukprot:scaffold3795_cov33-Cyclotella_meneghiniana.AAC.1